MELHELKILKLKLELNANFRQNIQYIKKYACDILGTFHGIHVFYGRSLKN